MGASTLEALEEAVQNYKVLAKTVAPHSEQAKNIIRRLVQLRMKLFEAKVCVMETFFCIRCPFSGPPRNCVFNLSVCLHTCAFCIVLLLLLLLKLAHTRLPSVGTGADPGCWQSACR